MDPTKHPAHPKQRFLVPGASGGWNESNSELKGGLGYKHAPARKPRLIDQESETKLQRIRDGLSIIDEPEALDEDDWARYVDREAKQKAMAREAGEDRDRKLLSQEERLAQAVAEAKRMRRDVSREVLVLKRLKKRGKVEQLEKWTQRIEQIARLGRAA